MSEPMSERDFNELLIRRINRDGTAERLCSVAHDEIARLRAEVEKLRAEAGQARTIALEEAAREMKEVKDKWLNGSTAKGLKVAFVESVFQDFDAAIRAMIRTSDTGTPSQLGE